MYTRTQKSRKGVFVSYSHSDEKWLEKLRVHLTPFIQGEALTLWDDTQIKAGQKWEQEIEKGISTCRVAVLLVSPEFLASEFITKYELPRIIEGTFSGNLTLIWIAVSHSLYTNSPLVQFQAANDPSKPLDTLTSAAQNEVLVKIAQQIARAMDINALSNTFSIVDDFVPQAKAFEEGIEEPTTKVTHSVIAHQQQTTIKFKTDSGITEMITAEDLKKLDPQSRKLIRAYEATLQDLFDRWIELKPKRAARDSDIRKEAHQQSEEIKNALCSELNHILDYVQFMGKSLEDHYQHARFICRDA